MLLSVLATQLFWLWVALFLLLVALGLAAYQYLEWSTKSQLEKNLDAINKRVDKLSKK